MSLIQQLSGLLQGDNLQALSNQLGQDSQTTQSAISSALPMLIGALAKNSSNEEGANALSGALDRDHDGSILDNLGGLMSNAQSGAGAGILKHLFGGKQEHVTQGLSQMNGMDSGTTSTLLQSLAPMVLGFLGQQKRQQGLDVNGLSQFIGQGHQQSSSAMPKGMDMVMGLLDRDGDGSVIDDIMGMAGGLFGKK